ncbi:MAG: hypothetical protein HC796_06430 [Synechococcaceae cyanobacterium RL_1_2]|nr:hypothetical protein [Synechococcaceae cyanobacterium RL_1_2]
MKRISSILLGFSAVSLIPLSGCGFVSKIVTSKPVVVIGTTLLEVALECALKGCFNDQAAADELKDSPEIYVEAYFNAINEGRYEDGWYSLSPKFQTKMATEGGYASYLNWWRDQVKTVDVNSIEMLSQTDQEAVIDTNLTFHKHNGKSPSQTIRLVLIWEDNSKRWIFDESKKPK